MAETDRSTGEDDQQPGLAALFRPDVASTAPLRNDSRLLDVAPIRTPVLDSRAGSALDSVVDSRVGSALDSVVDSRVGSALDSVVDSRVDSVVADPSRLSDTAAVARRGRDTR